MKITTKIMSCLVALLALSCAKADPNTLVVGTNAEFPPFEYLENGEVVGFDVELIHAVAEVLGKKVKIENLSWVGLLPALQGKKVDLIIAGMAITEDRQTIVNFSDVYYVAAEQTIVAHQNSVDLNSVDDLVGKQVGALLGYTGEILVSDLEGVHVETYNEAPQAILDLQNGKLDALVLDSLPAENYVKNANNLKAIVIEDSEEEYAIAIRKEDTALLADVNKALATVKANGTYDAIASKYFPEN